MGLPSHQGGVTFARVKGDSPHDHPGKKSRSRSTRGKQQIADHNSGLLPQPLARGLSALQLGGGFLVIAAVFIGPLLAGSYYEPWRWPLVYTSAAAAALLILTSRFNRSLDWGLAILLVWPILQGIWMYFNAWGEFSQSSAQDTTQLPWRINQLPDQPFPALPGTADKVEAFDRLSYILPCLGLIWGVRQIVVARPSWCQLLAKSIFWSGVAVAIIGLLQRATGTSAILWLEELDQGLLRKFFFATFRSPGIATCFLNLSLALGLATALNAMRTESDESSNHGHRDKRGRGAERGRRGSYRSRHPMAYLLLCCAGVVILIIAVITAGSKAGMALGVLTIILFTILNRHAISKAFNETSSQLFFGNREVERNVFLGAIVSITILLLMSFSGLMYERWSGAHKVGYSSMSGRIQANEVMTKMISDDGWGAMGTGPGSFYPLFPYYTNEIDSMIMGVWNYAHNDYLQTLVEWGWLGTGCLAACIGGGFLLIARELFYHRDNHSKTRFIFLRGYMVAMTTFLIHATIEFPFQIESLAVVFSVILGVAWAAADLRGRDIRFRTRRHPSKDAHRYHFEKLSKHSGNSRDR